MKKFQNVAPRTNTNMGQRAKAQASKEGKANLNKSAFVVNSK